jgi:hypothetical protein
MNYEHINTKKIDFLKLITLQSTLMTDLYTINNTLTYSTKRNNRVAFHLYWRLLEMSNITWPQAYVRVLQENSLKIVCLAATADSNFRTL